MFQQIWPTRQPDGTIFERHVYFGPQGEGYIDISSREKSKGIYETKAVHHGPENRQSDSDFKEVKALDLNIKFARIKEGKAEWQPEKGFTVKPEFKEEIKDDGSIKAIETAEPIKEETPDAGSSKATI